MLRAQCAVLGKTTWRTANDKSVDAKDAEKSKKGRKEISTVLNGKWGIGRFVPTDFKVELRSAHFRFPLRNFADFALGSSDFSVGFDRLTNNASTARDAKERQ